jgi:DNA (cytosine-5)-methyltransferase 1
MAYEVAEAHDTSSRDPAKLTGHGAVPQLQADDVRAGETRPVAISLFTGAGGLDYGFEAAGFQTSVAVEMDHDCCETIRRSRPTWRVMERSIFEVSTPEMLELAGRRAGDIDVLVGGPPCQPFSKAGYWAQGDSLRLRDPRADTLSAYLRVLEEATPRVFLLENVEGLIYRGKDEGLRLLLDRITEINQRTMSNYQPVVKVLNAADFGAPQRRARVFLIGARDGAPFHFPEPTHRDPDDALTPRSCTLPRYRTAWDALANVGPEPGEDLKPKGKWAGLLPSIPEGENYLWHSARGGGKQLFGWRTRYWSFLLKLAKARPSWTIQAQPGPAIGPFHWDNRRLSMRELCRIQTFPDDVVIFGGRTSVQKQVGNAVPSLLAEVLGRAIRTQLLGLPVLHEPLHLLPRSRGEPPPPEPVAPVPRKFLALEGRHAAHPGTGKGNGARRQKTLLEGLTDESPKSPVASAVQHLQ